MALDIFHADGECLSPVWLTGHTARYGLLSASSATRVYRASPSGRPVRSNRPEPAVSQPNPLNRGA